MAWTLPALLAVALVALLGYFGFARGLLAPDPAAPAPAKSIAVLPLANESGDPQERYFSDGISEDLITALSRMRGLKVIGRTSSFRFRDSKEDSKSIAAQLGVTNLLVGSVRRAGDIVRVHTELIDAADARTLWSERYDRPYRDLFALQDDITRAVAGALNVKLGGSETSGDQSDRPPSGSLDAYNAFLQGRFYELRNSEAATRQSIEHYTQAVELDSRYALAWSGLAMAWAHFGSSYLEHGAAQDAYLNADAASASALRLAPDLAAAHIARSYLLETRDLDWRGSERETRRALELAPNDSPATFSLGTQLARVGQVDQAIDLTRRALASDPLRANWYNWLAIYLLGAARLDEAERAIRRSIELQPDAENNHQTLTMIEIERGDAVAALAAARQALPGSWRDISLAQALQIGTNREAADAALKTLIDRYGALATYQIAQAYALRRDADETFAWLNQAWERHDSGIQFLLYDPFMKRYRSDPRFAALCRRVGLPTPSCPVTSVRCAPTA